MSKFFWRFQSFLKNPESQVYSMESFLDNLESQVYSMQLWIPSLPYAKLF